ncbi:MAG: DUF488 domain-containing protein [Armatimonadetes bacterium]|nr:DUF488 domain-containing protein [Armatimonadota bacterium]
MNKAGIRARRAEPFLGGRGMNETETPLTIYTVGHSNQSAEAFLRLLTDAGIDTLADVRSAPASRYLPQFNQRDLQESVENVGLRYVFFGDSLGGRPPKPSFTTKPVTSATTK